MWSQVLSVWLFGLAGSLHCSSMCGLLAGSVCTKGHKKQIHFYVARLCAYSILGFSGGLIGSLFFKPIFVSQKFSILISIFMIGYGTLQILNLNFGLKNKIFKSKIKYKIFPFHDSFSKGLMTALLPCGFLYTALTQSIIISHPIYSAMAMSGFSLFTTPALMFSGKLFYFLASKIKIKTHVVAGLFMIITGGFYFKKSFNNTPNCHSHHSNHH